MMASGRKKSPIWEFFVVAEDSSLAKCGVCDTEVPCGSKSTKSFTTMNLVHHLKVKHSEEFKEYTKLKEDSDRKKKGESSASDCTLLKQVSLQESAGLRKIWDINDA